MVKNTVVLEEQGNNRIVLPLSKSPGILIFLHNCFFKKKKQKNMWMEKAEVSIAPILVIVKSQLN
jgi:hypothetical protein